MDYRSLPRISNSDLTAFRNHLFGYPDRKPIKAFAFGSALHELVLEPNTILQLPDQSLDLALIQQLARQVQCNRFCKWALQFSRKEVVQLWQCPITGLPLKSKLDIVHKKRIIVDIKSTSQRTEAGFRLSCYQYDYDRQAAFYLDSIGAKRFILIGVQKTSPFNLFHFDATAEPGFIDSGRKKYRALLREWKRQASDGRPFVPTSWQVFQPETVEEYA